MKAHVTFVREGDLQAGEAFQVRISGIGYGDTHVFLDANNHVTRVRETGGKDTHTPSWQVEQVLRDLQLVDADD